MGYETPQLQSPPEISHGLYWHFNIERFGAIIGLQIVHEGGSEEGKE